MNDWLDCQWGDIVTLEYGKALKGYKDKTDGYRVYGTNGPIGFTDRFLSEKEGVIIGRKGAYRGVHYSPDPFFVIDTAFYLKPKANNLIDMKWAYYKLLTVDINSMDSGSAIPSTSRSDFYDLNLQLPPIEEQKKVAAFLSVLDEKIHINQGINTTLENMAMTLYENWFVDFEPFQNSDFEETDIGMIPKGWLLKTLNDVSDIKGGKRLPKGESVQEDPTDHRYIRVKDFNDNGINVESVQYITKKAHEATKQYTIDSKDIYISIVGTIGLVGFIPSIFSGANLTENAVKITNIDKKLGKEYILCYLRSGSGKNELNSRTVGSNQPKLPIYNIRSIPILVPEEKVITKFNQLVQPYYESIEINTLNNLELKNMRNFLLPRLLSGEIEINKEVVGAL